MNNFSIRMNKNERIRQQQMAFDYAMYMIVASYYKSAKCCTCLQEDKMYIRYQELKAQQQYEMEEQCIAFVEKNLTHIMSPEIWNEVVKVKLIGNSLSDDSCDVPLYGLFLDRVGRFML